MFWALKFGISDHKIIIKKKGEGEGCEKYSIFLLMNDNLDLMIIKCSLHSWMDCYA